MLILRVKWVKGLAIVLCLLNIVGVIVILSFVPKWSSRDKRATQEPSSSSASLYLSPSSQQAQELSNISAHENHKLIGHNKYNKNNYGQQDYRKNIPTTTQKRPRSVHPNEIVDRFDMDSKGVLILHKDRPSHSPTPKPKVTMPLFQVIPVVPEGRYFNIAY